MRTKGSDLAAGSYILSTVCRDLNFASFGRIFACVHPWFQPMKFKCVINVIDFKKIQVVCCRLGGENEAGSRNGSFQ